MANDNETPGTALWRRTLEHLLANGSTPADALDGANLILQAYRRQVASAAVPTASPESQPGTSAVPTNEMEKTTRVSGVRRRSNSVKLRVK